MHLEFLNWIRLTNEHLVIRKKKNTLVINNKYGNSLKKCLVINKFFNFLILIISLRISVYIDNKCLCSPIKKTC